MVPDFVAPSVDLLQHVPVLVYPKTYQEEGGFYIVPVQYVKYLGSVLVSIGCIKAYCDFFLLCLNAVYRQSPVVVEQYRYYSGSITLGINHRNRNQQKNQQQLFYQTFPYKKYPHLPGPQKYYFIIYLFGDSEYITQ